jgi:hypothetical protein
LRLALREASESLFAEVPDVAPCIELDDVPVLVGVVVAAFWLCEVVCPVAGAVVFEEETVLLQPTAKNATAIPIKANFFI